MIMEKFDSASCPNCGKVANNETEVESLFGLRTMENGIMSPIMV